MSRRFDFLNFVCIFSVRFCDGGGGVGACNLENAMSEFLLGSSVVCSNRSTGFQGDGSWSMKSSKHTTTTTATTARVRGQAAKDFE